MSTFHEQTCFCPKSLSENNRRPTSLISHPCNCSVAFAMYVHVYYKNRVNKIIFNILNQIHFLDPKTNIQRVKSCQSDCKRLGVFFLVNYVHNQLSTLKRNSKWCTIYTRVICTIGYPTCNILQKSSTAVFFSLIIKNKIKAISRYLVYMYVQLIIKASTSYLESYGRS